MSEGYKGTICNVVFKTEEDFKIHNGKSHHNRVEGILRDI